MYNVALHKKTWQTSTAVMQHTTATGESDKAVDGCLVNQPWEAGCCTHTTGLLEVWWTVDLGRPMNVYAVDVLSRGGCCSEYHFVLVTCVLILL